MFTELPIVIVDAARKHADCIAQRPEAAREDTSQAAFDLLGALDFGLSLL